MEKIEIIEIYNDKKHLFEKFLERIKNEFLLTPELGSDIHSVRYRLKDIDHLIEKIERKEQLGRNIDKDNIFNEITDIAGIRVLHLYSKQFESIHDYIMRKISENEYVLFEQPIAYTWDPESDTFFRSKGLRTSIKESYYTSIHYVIMPKINSEIKCEIQVRNLFEEIWGEIDHIINYPQKCQKILAVEQIKVLARLSSTGTKLVDSIFLSAK